MRIAWHLIRKRRTCPKSCTSMYTPVGQKLRFAATCHTLRILAIDKERIASKALQFTPFEKRQFMTKSIHLKREEDKQL